MCLPQMSPELRRQITAESETLLPAITLPWMMAFGADTIRIVQEMRGRSNDIVQGYRYRFAAVTQSMPGSWSSEGGTLSADGIDTDDVDISATTDKLWMQVELGSRLSTSGTPGEALSMIRAIASGAGRLVADRNINVEPDLESSSVAYHPLCAPMPSLGLSKLMFAVEISAVSGTLTYRFAWRTFASDPMLPGTWTDLQTDRNTSSATTLNSDTISVAPGTTLYWQPALKIVSTTARAQVRTRVAAKY